MSTNRGNFTAGRRVREVGLHLKVVSCAVLGVPLLAPVLPATRAGWTTANMLAPRDSQSAVALSPNKLLVTGGEGLGSVFGAPTNTTEIYNLTSNTWKFAGPMSTSRVGQIALRLANGDVLVAGGQDNYAVPLQSAEVFAVGPGTWTPVASMPTPAVAQSAVLLGDGDVLVTGGVVADRVSRQALLYNYRANTWTLAASMKHPRAGHESILLPDGDVLVAGGTTPYAELYVPRLNRWEPAGHPGKRLFPAVVRSGRSEVLMAGGSLVDGGCLASALVYMGGAIWTQVPPMESLRCAPLSTALPNGSALVGGGFGASTWSTMQQFEFKSMKWRAFPSLPGPRAAGTLTYMNGSLIAAGGTVEGDEISTSVALRIGG
jgi:Galactose oxidase, central domain